MVFAQKQITLLLGSDVRYSPCVREHRASIMVELALTQELFNLLMVQIALANLAIAILHFYYQHLR